ncbi:hypothetical protein PHET_01318 [Paragonimus heterotremus]|uniref:RING-type domain-containing protein n=1 Tax=Paragonimus heterotremus TaxID=100268 RepID=A0A8J4WUP8_9TREM|nr:hypothetical protein PHET_01318 [Paragonimus heterotremus]
MGVDHSKLDDFSTQLIEDRLRQSQYNSTIIERHDYSRIKHHTNHLVAHIMHKNLGSSEWKRAELSQGLFTENDLEQIRTFIDRDLTQLQSKYISSYPLTEPRRSVSAVVPLWNQDYSTIYGSTVPSSLNSPNSPTVTENSPTLEGAECVHPTKQQKWKKKFHFFWGPVRPHSHRHHHSEERFQRAKSHEDLISTWARVRRATYHQVGKYPECAVCLEEFALGDVLLTLPCFHTFHKKCTESWLALHPDCPVCRVNLRKISNGSSI